MKKITFYLLLFMMTLAFSLPCNAATVISVINLPGEYLDLYSVVPAGGSYTIYAPSGTYISGFTVIPDEDGSTYGSIILNSPNFSNTYWTYYGSQVNNVNMGNYLTITKSGTMIFGIKEIQVYFSADVADNASVIQARDAANSANTAAQGSKTSADSAKSSADTASARAQTTINQTWYTGTYGGVAENVANLAGYIRMPK